MKLEIYGKEAIPEEPIRLALKRGGAGSVILYAVDSEGAGFSASNLLTIYPDGTFSRIAQVNDRLGFSLDDFDRIEEKGV